LSARSAKQGTGRAVSFQFVGDLGDASAGAGLIFVGARAAADPDRDFRGNARDRKFADSPLEGMVSAIAEDATER
jgi:hypothetical protein